MFNGIGSSMSLTETIKTMVKKASLLSAALLLLAGEPCRADTAPGGVPEYRLKAAYIHKILPFVHWPKGGEVKDTLASLRGTNKKRQSPDGLCLLCSAVLAHA